MKSKIRVEFDFNKSEPYVEFTFVKTPLAENETEDMRDAMLSHFIKNAEKSNLNLKHSQGGQNFSTNVGFSTYELRITKPEPTKKSEPLSPREYADTNFIKVRATYYQSYGKNGYFENHKTYDIKFSIYENYISVLHEPQTDDGVEEFVRYKDFEQFLSYWTIIK